MKRRRDGDEFSSDTGLKALQQQPQQQQPQQQQQQQQQPQYSSMLPAAHAGMQYGDTGVSSLSGGGGWGGGAALQAHAGGGFQQAAWGSSAGAGSSAMQEGGSCGFASPRAMPAPSYAALFRGGSSGGRGGLAVSAAAAAGAVAATPAASAVAAPQPHLQQQLLPAAFGAPAMGAPAMPGGGGGGGADRLPCSYCTRLYSERNLLECERCCLFFCSVCSTTNYSRRDDRTFCLPCNEDTVREEAPAMVTGGRGGCGGGSAAAAAAAPFSTASYEEGMQ